MVTLLVYAALGGALFFIVIELRSPSDICPRLRLSLPNVIRRLAKLSARLNGPASHRQNGRRLSKRLDLSE